MMDNRFRGPGPGFVPGMGPIPGGMPLELESAFIYNGVTNSTKKLVKYRINADIVNARKISNKNFVAKMKARKKIRNVKSNIRLVNKWLRRYKARIYILESMSLSDKAAAYGDSLMIRSGLSTEQVIEKLNETCDNVRVGKIGIIGKIVNKIDDISEKAYISKFKAEATLKYNKKAKRDQEILECGREVAHRKDILNGYLYHNYNILSIFLGKLDNESFSNMLPDPIDKKVLNSYMSVVDGNHAPQQERSEEPVQESLDEPLVETEQVEQNTNNATKAKDSNAYNNAVSYTFNDLFGSNDMDSKEYEMGDSLDGFDLSEKTTDSDKKDNSDLHDGMFDLYNVEFQTDEDENTKRRGK